MTLIERIYADRFSITQLLTKLLNYEIKVCFNYGNFCIPGNFGIPVSFVA